jgi:ribosome biogenesis GTPase / thiamine phosphate phosphatase
LSLSDLGWNAHFEEHFAPHAGDGLIAGRVAVEHRDAYAVYTEDGDCWAELAGRLRHEAITRDELPAVGDWVALQPLPEKRAIVHAVLPRLTKFSRTAASDQQRVSGEQVLAANVDTVFLVSSLNRDLNVRRIERYLVTAWESGAAPAIVLNKADLCEPDQRAGLVAEVEAVAFGVPVHVASAVTGEGIDELDSYLTPGRTVVLLGSSGVGKSTLVNRFAGRELLATREIRDDGRGRHTTSHRELVVLEGGGLVLDTPGLRELQLFEGSEAMDDVFEDVAGIAAECRFSDCEHRTEPGCAVKAAIADGSLDAERLESYRKLERELERAERKRDARLAAEYRRRWRTAARAQRQRSKPRR